MGRNILCEGHGCENERHAGRVVEVLLEDVGEVVAEGVDAGPRQHVSIASRISSGLWENVPLVHHVWTHSKNDAMQIARLGGVAEDFTPAGFFLIRLSFDGGEDLLELSDHFFIVDRLVKKTADGVLGLSGELTSSPPSRTKKNVMTYLIDFSSLRQPPRRLAQERTKRQNNHGEQDLTRDGEAPLQ